MFQRPQLRAVAAVAAAGTICALGAASVAAASSTSAWSPRRGPVPHAFTDAAPALTAVSFGSRPAADTLVAWKGQAGEHVFYEASATPALHAGWTARAAIPGAATNAAPSISAYRDPNGREAVLAVWKGRTDQLVHYAQGETNANRTISWTAVHTLPTAALNVTDAAPAVFFPEHKYVAVVAFRGPFDHIRTIIGTPDHRGFTWSASRVVSPSAVSGSGPAIAEQQSSTGHGKIFVFWKDHKSSQISFATTGDPVASPTSWTPVTALAGSVTSAIPAASAVGPHGTGPLLLAYKAPHSTHVLYRTLTGGTWSAPLRVPGTQTTWGPALLRGQLATTSPTSAGNIFFHFFR
jgi:hypothetical protein